MQKFQNNKKKCTEKIPKDVLQKKWVECKLCQEDYDLDKLTRSLKGIKDLLSNFGKLSDENNSKDY